MALRLANVSTPNFANIALQGEQVQAGRQNRAIQGQTAQIKLQNAQNQAAQFAKTEKVKDFQRNLQVVTAVSKGVIDETKWIASKQNAIDLGGSPEFIEKIWGTKFNPEEFKKKVESINKLSKSLGLTKPKKLISTGPGTILKDPVTGEQVGKATPFKPPEIIQLQKQVDILSKDPTRNSQRIKNLEARIKILDTPKEKAGKSFILPNNTIVQSFDGGRTFVDKSGKKQSLIGKNALPITGGFTGADFQVLTAKQQVKKAREGATLQSTRKRTISAISLNGSTIILLSLAGLLNQKIDHHFLIYQNLNLKDY